MTKLFASLSLAPLALLLVASPILAFDLDIALSAPQGTGVSDLGTLFSALFTLAVVLAIVVVFFMIILGGYGFITAGGDKTKAQAARARITNAIIGLGIVASSFAVIALVADFFGLDIENLDLPSAGSTLP
jgi:hypothetical protein